MGARAGRSLPGDEQPARTGEQVDADQIRLIAAEESFLNAKLGEPYTAYCAKVPRLVPAITPRVPASTLQPKSPTAFLGEIYMWGVVATFTILGWRYNSILLIKGILVSLGISLIVRAFLPKR